MGENLHYYTGGNSHGLDLKLHLPELKAHHSLASYLGRSLLDHLFVGAGLSEPLDSCHGTVHVSNIIHRDSFAAGVWQLTWVRDAELVLAERLR